MTLEQALDTALRAESGINTALGGRIYWLQAAQTATMPYLVYTVVSDVDEQATFDAKNTGRGLVQFDVVGSTKANKAIMYAIRTLLRGKSGAIGGLNTAIVAPRNVREEYKPDTNKYVFSWEAEITYSYE